MKDNIRTERKMVRENFHGLIALATKANSKTTCSKEKVFNFCHSYRQVQVGRWKSVRGRVERIKNEWKRDVYLV